MKKDKKPSSSQNNIRRLKGFVSIVLYGLVKTLKSLRNIWRRKKELRSSLRSVGTVASAMVGGGMLGSCIPGIGTVAGTIIGAIVVSNITAFVLKHFSRLLSWVSHQCDSELPINPPSPDKWKCNKTYAHIIQELYQHKKSESWFIIPGTEADERNKTWDTLREVIVKKDNPYTADNASRLYPYYKSKQYGLVLNKYLKEYAQNNPNVEVVRVSPKG